MSYTPNQTKRFARQYKKLHDHIASSVDDAVTLICEQPDIGDRKKGDLASLWVYKFRVDGQLYLLGYSRDDTIRLIYLEAIGSHENFYRDMKR